MGRHTQDREYRTEKEEKPRKRRKKKKSKFGYYLYAVMILVLTIANITIATFLLTYVQKIKVTGTKHSTDAQIVQWVKEDPFTMNSIYAVVKFQTGSYKMPSYLEKVSVGWDMPWGLSVQVKEKEVVGGIIIDGEYVYFAEDGTVMKKSNEPLKNIVTVDGVKVKSAELYKKISLKDKKMISYITDVSAELEKQEISPELVRWEDNSMNLYFGEVCVKLGKLNYDTKIMQIPPILKKLDGKQGILHLEHFDEMSTSVSFEEKK